MEIMAFIFGSLGISFGISGYIFGALAKKRVSQLESELIKLNVLSKDYQSS